MVLRLSLGGPGAFSIGRTRVTNDQYVVYVAAVGVDHLGYWSHATTQT
jgi:hypothetical protein